MSDSTTRMAKFLRYYSTKSGDKMISFDEYMSRMDDDQPGIYYVLCDSKEEVEESSFLNRLTNRGYEVLYMIYRYDKDTIEQLKEYRGKMLISVTEDVLNEFSGEEDEEDESEEQDGEGDEDENNFRIFNGSEHDNWIFRDASGENVGRREDIPVRSKIISRIPESRKKFRELYKVDLTVEDDIEIAGKDLNDPNTWRAKLYSCDIEGYQGKKVEVFQYTNKNNYKAIRLNSAKPDSLTSREPLVKFDRTKYPPNMDGVNKLTVHLKEAALAEGTFLVRSRDPYVLSCRRCRLYGHHKAKKSKEQEENRAGDTKKRHRRPKPESDGHICSYLPLVKEKLCKASLRFGIRDGPEGYIYMKQGLGSPFHTHHPKPTLPIVFKKPIKINSHKPKQDKDSAKEGSAVAHDKDSAKGDFSAANTKGVDNSAATVEDSSASESSNEDDMNSFGAHQKMETTPRQENSRLSDDYATNFALARQALNSCNHSQFSVPTAATFQMLPGLTNHARLDPTAASLLPQHFGLDNAALERRLGAATGSQVEKSETSHADLISVFTEMLPLFSCENSRRRLLQSLQQLRRDQSMNLVKRQKLEHA